MTRLGDLLAVLARAGVEYILVGGAAATAHGSARLTSDVDVVYRRTFDNLERLARALAPYTPYLRGAPEGLPFVLDARTLQQGLNSRSTRRSEMSTCWGRSPGAEATTPCCRTRWSSLRSGTPAGASICPRSSG